MSTDRDESPVTLGAQQGSVAPGDLVYIRSDIASVQRVIIHRKGYKCRAIREGYQVIEVVTGLGSRWIGADDASIESDLRVHWNRY